MTLCLPKRIMINELKSNREILGCVLSGSIIWIHLLSPGWSCSLLLSTMLPLKCLTRISTQQQRTRTIVQTFTFYICAINQHLQQSVLFSDGGRGVSSVHDWHIRFCLVLSLSMYWRTICLPVWGLQCPVECVFVCLTICLVPRVSNKHGSTLLAPVTIMVVAGFIRVNGFYAKYH